MKRRYFLKLIPVVCLPLSACRSQPSVGPVEIIWDRDTCVRCGMVISDRDYAAQARNADQKVFKFDDIGCAIFYTEHLPGGITEFWVSSQNGNWLEARQAYYLGGKRSPMGYGYVAIADTSEKTIDFNTMKKNILALGK